MQNAEVFSVSTYNGKDVALLAFDFFALDLCTLKMVSYFKVLYIRSLCTLDCPGQFSNIGKKKLSKSKF